MGRRSLFCLVVMAMMLIVIQGCSTFNDERGVGDAPRGELHEAPRQVWQNLDRFPNISAFCIGENGLYTTTREAPPVVVENDPNCDVGGILANR